MHLGFSGNENIFYLERIADRLCIFSVVIIIQYNLEYFTRRGNGRKEGGEKKKERKERKKKKHTPSPRAQVRDRVWRASPWILFESPLSFRLIKCSTLFGVGGLRITPGHTSVCLTSEKCFVCETPEAASRKLSTLSRPSLFRRYLPRFAVKSIFFKTLPLKMWGHLDPRNISNKLGSKLHSVNCEYLKIRVCKKIGGLWTC